MSKKFLTIFSGIAAAFASSAVSAKFDDHQHVAPQISQENVSSHKNINGQVFVTNNQGDEFEFVLKRSEQDGMMIASHSSHRSHYSSR